jgi:glucoamylase
VRRSARRSRVSTITTLLAALAAAAAVAAAPSDGAVPDTRASGTAPDGPGTLSRFDLARKDCVGTARNDGSTVWFTVADGVLSDVYEPTIDNTDVQSLQYVVTDGATFTDLQERDTTYTVSTQDHGMRCTVVSRSAAHHYTLTTTYIADPERDTVLMRTRLTSAQPLAVYARLDGHVNGNGGGGPDNGGADSGRVLATGVPVIGDTSTTSEATNRNYAVPTFMALDSPSLHAASVGYAGTDSDGLAELDADHALSTTYGSAPDGHIVATANVTPAGRGRPVTLALGFGRTAKGAARTAAQSLTEGFARADTVYGKQWRRYDNGRRRPFPRDVHRPRLRRAYLFDANVLKASEDKTFPGAIAASLASPWGQAVSAGSLVNGKPVYFGSYREVFGRDLYEAATGFLADGDVQTARAAARFLFSRQQLPDGQLPRNSLLNGEVAPDTGGDQLDETAYALLLARLTTLTAGNDRYYRDHIVPAADWIVAHGPSYGVERWEEQSGYSPSTIAAEIAGLSAAAAMAGAHGDDSHLRLWQATADQFQRTVTSLTVTSDGPYSPQPYFVRLTKNGDPNSDDTYNLGNGSIDADQKSVVDGGFQELVRLGELPADDPDVTNSLSVIDSTIAATTPSGTGYYRYGTSATGSEDGYGDCWTPDPTSCPTDGQPWPTSDTGSGHLWPVLSGERAETAIAQGSFGLADRQLGFMLRSASGTGLVPEQVWEDPDLPASAYGADPTTASIGFTDGKPAGSAAPLTWAQAQELRLIRDIGNRRVLDRPAVTSRRYLRHGPPGMLPLSITAPSGGSTVQNTTTVSGTSAPNAVIDIESAGLDAVSTAIASTTADRSGAWSVSVPTPFGTDVLTATATADRGGAHTTYARRTGYSQVTVNGDLVGGKTILDVTDPTGDDDGPGTYQYPTASAFAPGSFDITRFQVLSKGGEIYLRTTLANLVNTFGSDIGAQLLDVYVHQPDASATSTAAAYPQRNYSIAAGDAWSQRLEVQGFAAPVWVDAGGNSPGTPTVVSSTAAKTVTIELPESSFGTPASGWSFVVTLHGQDGYSPDQARGFAATPQDYLFGVCAQGGTSPICAVDPSAVPKVMDTVTPDGVSQDAELDPTQGPVVLHGVPVG